MARILGSNGWFAFMYNNCYRCDPIQLNIENIIKEILPEYEYGFRRDNHAQIIRESKMFGSVVQISSSIVYKQKIKACVEAWSSPATLAGQVASKFDIIFKSIKDYSEGLGCVKI